jgi:hypothetical protein
MITRHYNGPKCVTLPKAMASIAVELASLVNIAGDAFDGADVQLDETGISEPRIIVDIIVDTFDQVVLACDRLMDVDYEVRMHPDYRTAHQMGIVELANGTVNIRATGR